MITIKSAEEIRKLRRGGKILAAVLRRLAAATRKGTSAEDLDCLAEKLLAKAGADSAFKGYRPNAAGRPFPANLCVSVNAVVVHGIPKKEIIFRSGDIVSLDLGVRFEGLFTDAAVTVAVGKIAKEERELIDISRQALYEGIKYAKVGRSLGDIGFAIQRCVEKHGLRLIQGLGGHGVGYSLHEDPFVANEGSPGSGPRLQEGMVLAIEPMVTAGSGRILMRPDGSFVTKDGYAAAHFEHTVAIAKKGPVILTS